MNVLEIAGLALYGTISLLVWRHIAYHIAKKEANGGDIDNDDIIWGIIGGLLMTFAWPLTLLVWYVKHEPILFRAHRDRRGRS